MEILSEDEEITRDTSSKEESKDKFDEKEEKKPQEELSKEIDGIEVKKKDKIFVVEKEKSEETDSDDDLSFDFSKIKGIFKRKKKDKEKKEIFEEKSDEDLSLNFKGILGFFNKNKKWLIPIFFILIAMFFAVYIRAQPAWLPVTDSWAEDSVYGFYKDQIRGSINQQYPNLPEQNKQTLIDQEFQKFLKDNKGMMEQQIEATSENFKQQLKDDDGQTYLIAIDPYYYLRHAQHYLDHGYAGTEYAGGTTAQKLMYPHIDFSKQVSWDGQRMAPVGGLAKMSFHTYVISYLYKFLSIFTDISLMGAAFWVPVLISALSVIPAFFIGRRLGGNIGGLFAAVMLAVHLAFVNRTVAGFSDTDAYNVFFPLLTVWFLFEAFATKDLKKRIGLIFLSSFSLGIFAYTWNGWWYIFNFILGAIVVYLIYLIAIKIKNIKEIWKDQSFKKALFVFLLFVLISGVFVSFFAGFNTFIDGFFQSGLRAVFGLKSVAVSTLWPNIRTTVAELNEASLKTIINQIGGMFLFLIAVIGVLLTVVKKDEEGKRDVKYAILLIIWFFGTIYATMSGIRFILLLVPAFALGFGAFCGIVYTYVSKWISNELKVPKWITQVVIIVLLAVLLISPIKASYNQAVNGEIPSMNDAWYSTLTKIKEESQPDAIINSWWDFGHWFITLADRSATFDGAGQDKHMAHWIGKSLLTKDEKTTIGILRMVDCGNNNAFWTLDKIFDDTPKTIDVLNEIVVEDKEEAMTVLNGYGLDAEQIASVLKYTHCQPPEDYYITSDDMVGKAGVWGHFGSWDFHRAEMYQQTNSLDPIEASSLLMENYNLSEEEADNIYYQIQNTEANRWISPWPGYMGTDLCRKENNELTCNFNIQDQEIIMGIDLNTLNTTVKNTQDLAYPNSLVYVTEDSIAEKEFSGNLAGFSLVLVPEGNNFRAVMADPLQSKSMFAQLFFFRGHGLECFDLFDEQRQVTGGMIYVWKVDWSCSSENNIFFQEPEEIVEEEIRASHILISTDDKTDEEALELIQEIKDQINETNFAELAEQYSEGPSAVNGGDLGWFGKGMMVKEFEEAAFSLEIGEVSEPVKTQFGWHLIVVVDRR
ncbi:STT3 domain-containing protein [Nanoarchaeota archaeon]